MTTELTVPAGPRSRRMYPYAYDTSDRDLPHWYENQPRQRDLSTATVWALHLTLAPGDLLNVLVIVSRLTQVTGEYFVEKDGSAVIYFRASQRFVQEETAEIIDVVGDCPWYLTTAGDYSEVRGGYGGWA